MHSKQTWRRIYMITMLVIVVMFFAACSDTQSDASDKDTGEAATANNPNNE